MSNEINSVLGGLYSDNPLATLNNSLVVFRPSDLEDREIVRRKLHAAVAAIEAGELDAMFARTAALRSEPDQPIQHTAADYRRLALHVLSQRLDNEDALSELIAAGKHAVAECRRQGVRPTDDAQLDAIKAHLGGNPGLFPKSFDRLYAAERIPLILFDRASNRIQREKLKETNQGRLTEARHLAVEPEIISQDRNKRDGAGFVLSDVMINGFRGRPIQFINAPVLERLPGSDYQKAKYELDRKRVELDRLRKKTGRRIPMWPDSNQLAAENANTSPARPDDGSIGSATGALGEAHFLLTCPIDEPERGLIRNRFDHVVNFHRAAMEHIDRKIEEHLQTARLPPPAPEPDLPAGGNGKPPADHSPEDRSPITAEAAVARADRFARSRLPEHHRLRALLQPTPTHPIIVKLTDDAGNTEESVITTFEPDADRALDIKRRVQAHLLDLPGVTPYRGPNHEGGYNVALDEMIPAAPPRDRITPKYGDYRLRLQWPEQREEMSISLGLNYSAANQQEAGRRARFVRDELAKLRRPDAGRPFLPLTKRDLTDLVKADALARNQPWQEPTRGAIEHYPAAFRLPISGRGDDRQSWLQVDPLQTDGNPNYTWILPMHIVVEGEKLTNATTHVNLHVRDREAAEARAIETVHRFLAQLDRMPPHARWALAPGRPPRLENLSEAARDAAPELLDTNRLKDIQNELRSPHQRDLEVRLVDVPREENGALHFKLGVFRGGANGLMEPVLKQPGGDAPPVAVDRGFAVPADQASEVARFEAAVNHTFRDVIGEEYHPRSARNYDHERLRKLKTPRPFNPEFAPKVLDDAIRSRLADHPQVTVDGVAPGGANEPGGFADRLQGRPRGPRERE